MTDTPSPDRTDSSEPSTAESTGVDGVAGDRSASVTSEQPSAQAQAPQGIGEIAYSERDRSYADAARAAVPEIGLGGCWYDIAYRLLQWSRKPPRDKALSQPARGADQSLDKHPLSLPRPRPGPGLEPRPPGA